jgi:hypothetical protein
MARPIIKHGMRYFAIDVRPADVERHEELAGAFPVPSECRLRSAWPFGISGAMMAGLLDRLFGNRFRVCCHAPTGEVRRLPLNRRPYRSHESRCHGTDAFLPTPPPDGTLRRASLTADFVGHGSVWDGPFGSGGDSKSPLPSSLMIGASRLAGLTSVLNQSGSSDKFLFRLPRRTVEQADAFAKVCLLGPGCLEGSWSVWPYDRQGSGCRPAVKDGMFMGLLHDVRPCVTSRTFSKSTASPSLWPMDDSVCMAIRRFPFRFFLSRV